MDFSALYAPPFLAFDAATRAYRLEGEGALAELLVEAWACREEFGEPWELCISALSARVGLDLDAFLGRPVTLQTALADGSLRGRTGLVFEASAEEADGGFARYGLVVRPWTQLLAHTRQSRVWQAQRLTRIIEDVFARYPLAKWRWADDIAEHLARSPFQSDDAAGASRRYTVQYRETDLDFVLRLLGEEGIAWRSVEDPGAPAGHTLVLFADSVSAASCPEDASSAAGVTSSAGKSVPGIRLHRTSAPETTDTLQTVGDLRSFQPAFTTVLSWDPSARRAVTATAPAPQSLMGAAAPRLEHYEPQAAERFASRAQAERAALLQQQSRDARRQTWFGHSTVRTLRTGECFTLLENPRHNPSDNPREIAGPGQALHAPPPRFLTTAVISAGINNLPKELDLRIAHGFGDAGCELLPAWVDETVRAQAAATGYGNHFQAVPATVPWRPVALVKPKAPALLLATVVGDGSLDEEIHTDRLGRIRIRHEFQGEGESSAWVRVLQRCAGPGMGTQFTPRIGQQVLVGFEDDDIDRPFVQGALYTGRGEGGLGATPGGPPGRPDDTAVFARSSDQRPSGQGNLTGGHSPAWHGGAPADLAAGGQRNDSALSGWKSQEFSGEGHNQLVFDDSHRQLRTQLATTQEATQLNLGHLIHQADNHRGSFRGLGFELRTDAWGTVRAGQGLLLSSYGTEPNHPAGDNAAGIALAGQFKALAKAFSEATGVHQTVRFASSIGSIGVGKSTLSEIEPPLAALHTALKGMVDAVSFDEATGDAAAKNTRTADKVPQTTDPVVALSARAGLVVSAGADLVLAAAETVTLGAGNDSATAVGGSARIHTGQAIGVLGGAIGPGNDASGTGITLIAAGGDVDIQAQGDALQVAARDDVSVQSRTAHIDWAAAKRVVLATTGGAHITIEGGNITVACPGTLTIRAARKSFGAPERVGYALPGFEHTEFCLSCFLRAAKTGSPLVPA